MAQKLSTPDVIRMLGDGRELAFVDVREIAQFGSGHPLLAANLPLSRLDVDASRLLPRADTRIVVTDGHGELSARAVGTLTRLRYDNVHWLEGGAAAWSAGGQVLFPEIDVVSKGFGAFARRHGAPRFISPEDLNSVLGQGGRGHWVVLDSRPRDEYVRGNIPGSTDAPGADLVRCFDDLVPDPATNVVVNCMSATRGILGGLSLQAAGVPNPIHVLHHGTRGWLLDGLELEKMATRFARAPSAAAVRAAGDRTRALLDRAGIERLDWPALEALRTDVERTTYLIDVRTKTEFEQGHIAGSTNAPEGDVVMSPQNYIATLNAHIVLIDDDGVRAGITALWLAQMGLGEVSVLSDGLAAAPLNVGPARFALPDCAHVKLVSAAELHAQIARGSVRIIDVGRSDEFERGHIRGARWCSRAHVNQYMQSATFATSTVLTSEDGTMAMCAGAEADVAARVLAGGNRAWHDAGHMLTRSAGEAISARDDHWLASSERPGDQRQNVIDYLEWEVTLLDDIERSGSVPYRNLIWR